MTAAGLRTAEMSMVLDRSPRSVRSVRSRTIGTRPGPAQWTPEEMDTVAAMTVERATLREIAAALPGRSPEGVRNLRRRMAEQWALPAVAWSEAELDTVREMTRKGHTKQEIAAALPGRTAEAVRAIRHRHRWPGHPGRPRGSVRVKVDLVDTNEL